MIKHCKLSNGSEFLCWTNQSEITFPKEFEITILDTEIKDITQHTELHNIPVLQYEQLQARFVSKCRTPDIQLEEEGIITFNDLWNAYTLLRMQKLYKSKRVRDLVEQKYKEVLYATDNPSNCDSEGETVSIDRSDMGQSPGDE